MPVIPALPEAEAGRSPEHFGRPRPADHLRSEVRDQPGHHGGTPSLLKIQKLAGCGDGVLLCHPGCSAVARSPLTATSASQVQAILMPQPPAFIFVAIINGIVLAEHGGSQGQEIKTIMANMHFVRPRQADHLRSGVQYQPGQHGETPISTKNTKISRLLGRLREVCLNPGGGDCNELLRRCTVAWKTANNLHEEDN
ncbi:putative uncharacterized protein SPANXA2-OT1 [Plecturocebus cupreus]